MSMPMTAPAELTSGPPESPSWMGASVCSMPCRVSLDLAPLSLAWMVRFFALMMPWAVDGRPPRPWALPIARTGSPSLTLPESPMLIVFRPEAPCRRSRAMSSLAS